MKITVFGGSKPRPGEPAYAQAQRLGELLAEAGFTIQNGGYIGTMEAVSRGAAEKGGNVIGITCAQIEAWRPVSPNPWLSEEIRFETLQERLLALINTCDGALALPGGPGTLTEISLMWNLLLTESISARPLIAIGPGWKATFENYYAQLGDYVPQEHRQWLIFAEDIEDAVRGLRESFGMRG
jgi:uncharacterized protein (TIGR00730 family)